MAPILGILIIIAAFIVLFIIGGGWWLPLLGVILGIIFLVIWIIKGDAAKSFETARSEDSRKEHAAVTWTRASQRNATVNCKSCNNSVSELAIVCPECGETLPGLRIQCPKCSSQHITISKKGFHVGQAAAGGIVLGLVGLAAGMIGSKDYEFVCLGCNHKWGLSKPKADSGHIETRSIAEVNSRKTERGKKLGATTTEVNADKSICSVCRRDCHWRSFDVNHVCPISNSRIKCERCGELFVPYQKYVRGETIWQQTVCGKCKSKELRAKRRLRKAKKAKETASN